VRSTGEGDPVGSLGPTAIGLAVEPVESPAGAREPSFAESVARNEGVRVGEGRLVANMLAARPRATAATSKSATNHGLDRADRRFIWLHRGSDVSANAAVGHETPIALSLQRRLMLERNPGSRFALARDFPD
jgi:hypothetical protein